MMTCSSLPSDFSLSSVNDGTLVGKVSRRFLKLVVFLLSWKPVKSAIICNDQMMRDEAVQINTIQNYCVLLHCHTGIFDYHFMRIVDSVCNNNRWDQKQAVQFDSQVKQHNEPYLKLCHKIKMVSLVWGPLIFSNTVMYGSKIFFSIVQIQET